MPQTGQTLVLMGGDGGGDPLHNRYPWLKVSGPALEHFLCHEPFSPQQFATPFEEVPHTGQTLASGVFIGDGSGGGEHGGEYGGVDGGSKGGTHGTVEGGNDGGGDEGDCDGGSNGTVEGGAEGDSDGGSRLGA